jgi:hypothetical protein
MQTYAIPRPSDGAMTRLLFAGRPPCWDVPLEGGRNLLTGKRHPVAAVVTFMEGGGRPAADAPVDVAEPPVTDTDAALRAFGVRDAGQLPEFARRLLELAPAHRDVSHADVSVVRGDGRRWLVALLDAACPPVRRRERASRAPHWRRWRRGLRTAYGLVAAGVITLGLLAGRGW